MKTVITTVGISLLENYAEEHDIEEELRKLGDTVYSEDAWKHLKPYRDKITKKITSSEWIQGNLKASAEIKSLAKMKKQLGAIRTILVTSDTVKGHLSGEILKELLPKEFEIEVDYVNRIQGFDVNSKQGEIIKEGFDSYIQFLLGNTYGGTVYNISGGYKAIIPISTLIASYRHVSLYYIYENSDYLVEIPPFPFQFDKTICGTFQSIFEKIEENDVIDENDSELKKFLQQLAPDEKDIFHSLTIQHEGVTFSEVGRIIWQDYKESLPIELIKSTHKPEEKPLKLRDDHGKDVLTEFGKKLRQCEYVEGIVNSLPFNPKERNFIHSVKEEGLVEVVLYWTDAGYGLAVQTTGRNKRETDDIAKILKKQYG